MHLVDVHAHLDHQEFSSDLEVVLQRAKAAGVRKIIAQGVNHESNIKVLELASRYDIVEAALGLYPSEAMSVELAEGHTRDTAYEVDTTLDFIEENANSIVAIGEVGMDFKESEDKKSQEELFKRIVGLAKKTRKPLIIHSRKAEKEVLDILEAEQFKRVVMHCFMGKKSLLQRGVKMGLYFSIPTAVTRIEQFQDNVEVIPVSQLFTETDAPYMGIYRDIKNEPSNISESIRKMAEIKRMDVQELANQIYFNYQKLFQ